MNLKYFAFVFAVLSVTYTNAQTKPKTSAQTLKPSKEVTLNYLNEKIQNYSVQYKKKIINWGTTNYNDGSSTEDHTNIYITGSGYRIFEANGTLYLQCTYTNRTVVNRAFEPKTDRTFSWVSTAPFANLQNVEVLRARTYRSGGYPIVLDNGSKSDEMVSYENDYLSFTFSSKCVFNKFDDNTEYVNWMNIAFREGEDNLLEKLKKAFLNLLTYYPKPAGDPFDN